MGDEESGARVAQVVEPQSWVELRFLNRRTVHLRVEPPMAKWAAIQSREGEILRTLVGHGRCEELDHESGESDCSATTVLGRHELDPSADFGRGLQDVDSRPEHVHPAKAKRGNLPEAEARVSREVHERPIWLLDSAGQPGDLLG